MSGYSNIVKVIFDKKLNFLHINTGSAGNKGLHKVLTVIRFVIDGNDIRDLEIWEMKRNEILL